jgi:UDPglucose--hexose-1-phosphate uridylyltransferase
MREWVAYATHRQDRTFLPPPEYCPLCPTKSGGFPTEVPRESYEIAVLENKFPSFSLGAYEPDEPGTALAPTASGSGVCEVVLYSDDHEATLAGMPERWIRNLVEVWVDRYRGLGARKEVAYVFIFENKGAAIGVTLHHPHGQIYGYPFVPPRLEEELKAARDHREEYGICLHCNLLAEEHADSRRILYKGDHFTTFVPFYARYPYEAHLYARRCVPSMADLTSAEKEELARALKYLLSGYDALYGFSLPYIMAMHQAPTDGREYGGLAHFHVEFYPPNRTAEKLKYLAGSEVGAGAFIVDAIPETTAAALHEAMERATTRPTEIGHP